MTTLRILRCAQDDNASFMERLLYIGNCSLTSSHNLPPAEANTRERGVGWGPFTLSPRQRSPDPVRGASPPAPPLYVWMSELQPVDNQCHRAIYCTNTILPQSFG